jgi:hypothetical protein
MTENDGMNAGTQPGCGNKGEIMYTSIGQYETEHAPRFPPDQQSLPRFQKRVPIGEQIGQRLPGKLAVTAAKQAAGGAVGIDDAFVAGDEQPFIDEFEQRKVDANFRAFRKVRNE